VLSGRGDVPNPYELALRLLARRELSTDQLRARLSRRGIPSADLEDAIARLTAARALDDTRTAMTYARRAVLVQLRGRRRVTQELTAIGLDTADIRHALTSVFDEVDEGTILVRALNKRLQGRLQTRAQFRRLYQALLRQGFEPDQVAQTLVARAGGTTAFMEE